MNRCVHQVARVNRDELPGVGGSSDELVVLANLHRVETPSLPPFAAIYQRGAERVISCARVLPPLVLSAIEEAHRVVASDVFAALGQSCELVGEPARRRIVVVVPVRDNITRCSLAAVISFVPDAVVAFEVYQSDSLVVRNQIPNFLAVCQNEQLDSTFGLLLLEALDRARKPLPTISCET